MKTRERIVWQAEPDTLFEDQNLRLRFSRGTSKTLFVSFTGVQHGLGGLPADEFIGTTHRHHSLFVSDMNRSWYNADGIVDQVSQQIDEIRRQEGVRRTVTIGNSMGGFGAILFARLISADVAFSFSPQFTVHPNREPFEKRWSTYTDKIDPWRYETPMPLRSECRYFVFSGTDNEEIAHTRQFPKSRNIRIYYVKGGHNISKSFKDAGLLKSVVSAGLRWPMPIASAIIRRHIRNGDESPLV
ncbi:hypothetical protein [Aurantimonas coralicida]|uniref:hypothetical protein n=1 Tax=Aurantimonas coralicida TaxID=182270 RepID=UPI001D1945DA|nr:hypothetical protein [Aurantimonas coralicida]MCC4298558.1 hypothetical protein [Aurantimonas coralicida]